MPGGAAPSAAGGCGGQPEQEAHSAAAPIALAGSAAGRCGGQPGPDALGTSHACRHAMN